MPNQTQREWLKLFLREEIKPMLDQHWERVLDLRGTPEKPFCKEGLMLDFFQAAAKKTDANSGFLVSRCLVPGPGPWWQALIAFYTLSAPEIWPSEREVCRDLVSYFEHVNPETCENFEVSNAEHLVLTEKGERENKFLTHPIEVCIALYALLWAQGTTMEEKEKHMEKLISEKTEALEGWEKGWDLIKGE